MNQQTHIEMVRELAKNPDEIYLSLDLRKCNLLHMAIGLGDEFLELQEAIAPIIESRIARGNPDPKDLVNLKEELGDFLFYTEGLIFGFEHELSHCKEGEGQVRSMDDAMNDMFRFVKRHVFYAQPPNIPELKVCYQSFLMHAETLAEQYAGCGLGLIRRENHEKLKGKRYAKGYSDAAATERADKK